MNTTDRSTEDRRRGPERRQLRSDDVSGSIMSELEGTLLKDADPFPYLMLVSFEASGLVRFMALLLLWPILRLLRALGAPPELGLRIMVFVAVAGVEAAEIEAVARAVLPKFLMDDVDMEAWTVFSSFQRRVVVTSWPRVMVEWFAKDHLQASDVVGRELEVNRSGRATGFFKGLDLKHAVHVQSASFFDVKDGSKPDVGLGRPESSAQPFLSLCKEQFHPPISSADIIKHSTEEPIVIRPRPVIFHDGRLVQRPTPLMALLIVLWIPLGVALVVVRIAVGLLVPIQWTPALAPFFGGKLIVRGRPPRPPASSSSSSGGGVLFVCTHRSLMDPVVLSTVLGRRVPAVTYSISRLTEMLSPIRTIRLSRNRQVDADRIRSELCRGDLVVCPEGTTCREPFLLRFSALFAELTDQIVPVAMNYRVGLFHATTARGWKAMDPIFFFMNPRPIYEVTFLNQLPVEVTCAAGKSPYDVANYVQRILAAALGFECTNFTRKDKYRVLAGNDGTVIVSKPAAMASAWPWATRAKEVLRFLL